MSKQRFSLVEGFGKLRFLVAKQKGQVVAVFRSKERAQSCVETMNATGGMFRALA